MSQVGIVRTNAILPFIAAYDLTGQEGRLVLFEPNVGENCVQLCYDTVLPPLGVLLTGGKEGETVSVAAFGGFAGTVRVKLADDVSKPGNLLGLSYDDDNNGSFATLAHTGLRMQVGIAMEAGVKGERIEAVLITPHIYEA